MASEKQAGIKDDGQDELARYNRFPPHQPEDIRRGVDSVSAKASHAILHRSDILQSLRPTLGIRRFRTLIRARQLYVGASMSQPCDLCPGASVPFLCDEKTTPHVVLDGMLFAAQICSCCLTT